MIYSLANKHYLKVADLAALEGDYYKAIENFERIGRASINNSLMKWSVKDYFMKAGICHLASNVSFINLFPLHEISLTWLPPRTWLQQTVPSSPTAKLTLPFRPRESTNCWLIWCRLSSRVTRKRSLTSSSSMTSLASWTSGRPPYYCGLRTISRRQWKISRRFSVSWWYLWWRTAIPFFLGLLYEPWCLMSFLKWCPVCDS